MRELVKEVVDALREEAEQQECELSFREIGKDGYLVSSDSGKIIAVGIVNINEEEKKKERVIGAFSINVNKYQWAEAEGFTQEQMIEDLQNEIFELMGVDEIIDYLCEEKSA